MENVPSMTVGSTRSLFREIMTELRAAGTGYRVVAKILHADRHGVPQRRRRLLAVGGAPRLPPRPGPVPGPARGEVSVRRRRPTARPGSRSRAAVPARRYTGSDACAPAGPVPTSLGERGRGRLLAGSAGRVGPTRVRRRRRPAPRRCTAPSRGPGDRERTGSPGGEHPDRYGAAQAPSYGGTERGAERCGAAHDDAGPGPRPAPASRPRPRPGAGARCRGRGRGVSRAGAPVRRRGGVPNEGGRPGTKGGVRRTREGGLRSGGCLAVAPPPPTVAAPPPPGYRGAAPSPRGGAWRGEGGGWGRPRPAADGARTERGRPSPPAPIGRGGLLPRRPRVEG